MIGRILAGLLMGAVTTAALWQVGTRGRLDVPAVYASRVAGIDGPAVTGVSIQNLDLREAATSVADLYAQNGGLEASLSLGTIAPGRATNLWLPTESQLNRGTYAAMVHADKPLAAIVRTDWPRSGGAAIYTNPVPSHDVVVPLVVRGSGQSSRISIQNTDPSAPAAVRALFSRAGRAGVALSHDFVIPPGTSINLDLVHGAEFEPLGVFIGSARVTANVPIAVQSFVDVTASDKAVYAFEGMPAEMAASTLLVPLFRGNQHPVVGNSRSGRLDTGISVVNPTSQPVDVTITYFGADHPSASAACRGREIDGPPVTIPPGSSHVYWQGDTAGQGLPESDCFGSAVVEAAGGGLIMAMVNDTLNLTQTAGAFNAFLREQASETVALPLYRKHHVGLTTGISIMNVGTEAATITIEFFMAMPDGDSEPVSCTAGCTGTVGPNQTFVIWPPAIPAIAEGSYGAAIVTSTQPVIVVVNDVGLSGSVDMATYSGIPVR